jgi:hypothetical protein
LKPNTTSTHVLGKDELDHVSKNYLQDVEGQIDIVIAYALNDFHVSDVNINFALNQEVDVKVG